MAQQDNRVPLAITAYFGSATASLVWIVHRALPPSEAGGQARDWRTLLRDVSLLWEHVLPSELAVFVFLNFFISALAMAALLTSMLFLGRLSVTESQRLSHRLVKYAVFKMVFVGSVITPDPRDIAVWLAWFAIVGYLRVFLGAAKDRLESLLAAPGAHLGRHTRGVCLLLLVLVHNVASFLAVLRLLPRQSLARVLLCAFDSAVIAIEGVKTLLRYVVHMADRYMSLRAASTAAAAAAEGVADLPAVPADAAALGGGWGGGAGAWSGCKFSFLYHAELVADVLVHAVTLAHYLHVWVLHGLSFHLIDAVLFMDMRAVLLSLLRRLRNHLTYRAATHRINHTFPDVHPAGGGGGGGADCTICMDEIVHVAKQLPCGHVFHLSCLRAWLQQSGSETFTCPNCRTPILVGGPGGRSAGAGGQAGGAGGGVGQERRQVPAWWITRLLDRAYVRLVVAVEPVLLTLLLRLTLWLGGRAQNRRRSARSQPSQPREGFGESPGPLPGRRISAATSYNSEDDAGEGRERGAPEGCDDDVYESEDSGYELYSEQDNSSDADSDAEGEGPPAPYGSRSWKGEARCGGGGGSGDGRCAARRGGEACELQQAEDGLVGGWRRMQGARRGTGAHCCEDHDHGQYGSPGCQQLLHQQSRRRPSGQRRSARRREGPTDVGADAALGAAGRGGRRRQGRADGGGAHGGDPAPSSPEARVAAAGRRRVLLGPPPSEEVPTYSGDVLARQAAAAARHIGRTVSVSLRSSWGAGGVCAGAVAGGGRDSDEEGPDQEVSSRRRRTRTSRTTRNRHRG